MAIVVRGSIDMHVLAEAMMSRPYQTIIPEQPADIPKKEGRF
jgi:hypothetical protein